MNSNLIYAVSLAVLFNCVISVAKNSEGDFENSSLNVTDRGFAPENLNETIFSEGNSLVSTSKSRIKPRKGAIPDNSTEILSPSSTTNITQDTASNSSISEIPALSNTTLSVNVSSVSNNVTVPSISATSTLKPEVTRPTTAPTTPSILIPKKKHHKHVAKKPPITYSADDNAQILDSEKNIKYTNVTNIEDVTIGPKTSSDTDRTIIEEQRTRRNYILYMGLAFALPMAFTLIHFSYKKIRNWMEIRHYERVDFLVDGMYIS